MDSDLVRISPQRAYGLCKDGCRTCVQLWKVYAEASYTHVKLSATDGPAGSLLDAEQARDAAWERYKAHFWSIHSVENAS